MIGQSWRDVESAARGFGLRWRGGFHTGTDDRLPDLPCGRPARTLILLGSIGRSLWPSFAAAPEYADGGPDPMDRWNRRLGEALAAQLGAAPIFPFGGPPHWPFQRWAQRADEVGPSPLGIQIHPDYGLWHAYRLALIFAERLELPPLERRPMPCASCAAKPCLSACPVEAFAPEGYDVQRCAGHIKSAAGAACMDQGCRARDACPVGVGYRYDAEQLRFHMEAFRRARR